MHFVFCMCWGHGQQHAITIRNQLRNYLIGKLRRHFALISKGSMIDGFLMKNSLVAGFDIAGVV